MIVRLNPILLVSVITLSFFYSCKKTRYISKSDYLLNKNIVQINKEQKEISVKDITSIISQKAHKKVFGAKLRLAFYNSIDTQKVSQNKIRKIAWNKKRNIQIREKNEQKKRKSKKQIQTPQFKDTINPLSGFLDWVQNKWGEAPIIYDCLSIQKSKKNIQSFLQKRGFFYSKISDTTIFHQKKREAEVIYKITTGKPYVLDTIYAQTGNQNIDKLIEEYMEKKNILKKGKILNFDFLDEKKEFVSNYVRERGYYEFLPKYIVYKILRDSSNMTAKVLIQSKDRKIKIPKFGDSLITKKHQQYKIRNIFFHLTAISKVEGKEQIQQNKKRSKNNYRLSNNKLLLLDTLTTKKATFYYNKKMLIKPYLLELENYLDQKKSNGEMVLYRYNYANLSQTRLMELGVFDSVNTVFKEQGLLNELDVHYYLYPSKKNRFYVKPWLSRTTGYLRLSVSGNYINNNLFRGAERLHISLTGGIQSQPTIFTTPQEGIGGAMQPKGQFIFDIGTKISLDMPGLIPYPAKLFPKRKMPHTIISLLYNYKNRVEFDRHLVIFDYDWKWFSNKKHTFKAKILNPISFSIITNESNQFRNVVNAIDDPFIRNSYSSQMTWEDIDFTYTFSNKEQQEKLGSKTHINNSFSIGHAGGLLSLITLNQDTTKFIDGRKTMFGVPYSQFVKIENDAKFYLHLDKKKSFNFRLNAAFAIPYNNSTVSVPFDYSYFAGGFSDNRGFGNRALGVGAYKYYADSNSTSTQMGDIKIALNIEYRFSLSKIFKMALFADVGNIWTFNKDPKRPRGQFTKDFYKQLAVSTGLGFRFDLNVVVFRIDVGLPLNVPSLPKGEQWIWNKHRPQWNKELEAVYGEKWNQYVVNQFLPVLNIGFGYPF